MWHPLDVTCKTFPASPKTNSKDLVGIFCPVPLHRSLSPNDPGQDILSWVKRIWVPPAVKTFLFKVHSETLPARIWMQDRDMFIP